MSTILVYNKWLRLVLVLVGLLLLLGACNNSTPAPSGVSQTASSTAQAVTLPPLKAVQLQPGEKLRVITTLNLIGDVVRQVGGDHIELTQLLPVGADPHGYTATPSDLQAISNAQVIFMVGQGLEESLLPVLAPQGSQAILVSVNAGLNLRALDHDTEHGGVDPHTWTSVPNVQQWVKNIAQVLATLDPANQADYQSAATAYAKELDRLESEITTALATIPQARRKLVTDHEVFGYFADHYGFTVVGTVVPGLSSLAAPSAQELAALQDQIKAEQVPAIFVGTTANAALADQLASDLGIKVVQLYSESLSAPDGPAATYVDFMRYNVAAIVAALK